MASISAEQTPAARTAAVDRFREGHIHVLVCTDLMARGIDFLNVQTVVNYDFPQSAVDYIHRFAPSAPSHNAALGSVRRPLSGGMLHVAAKRKLRHHILDQVQMYDWVLGEAFCAAAGLGGPGEPIARERPSPCLRRRTQV